MTKKELEQMLKEVQSGSRSVEQALEQMQEMPYKDLEYAKVDYHRELRNGFPEEKPGTDQRHRDRHAEKDEGQYPGFPDGRKGL